MDISYVLEFAVLADTKNFSAAAYQLHMSQAALSKHIQSMEKQLGHPLFIRTTRNVELSDYGQLYLPYAKQISESVRKAKDARIAFEKKSNARTMIGVVHNPDLFLSTELISGFRKEYPEIPIQIFEGSLKELRQEFLARRLHIISMAYSSWEKPQNHFIPAGQSRLAALIPKGHFLAEYENIPLKHLENVPLLVPEQTSFPYQYLLHFFRQEGIHPDIVYQGNTTGVKHLLKEGMGIFIQDEAIARTQMDEHLVIRRLEPDISYTFGLEYQNNLTKNERIYVKYIEKMLGTGNTTETNIVKVFHSAC